jgi:hypothetical protein
LAKAVQYFALASIFFATNGIGNRWTLALNPPVASPPGWRVNTNWLSFTIDPCSGSWHGVTCVNDQVTALAFGSTGLTGSIPFEITLLSSDSSTGAGSISYIDLSNNPYVFNNGDDNGLDWIGALGSNMRKFLNASCIRKGHDKDFALIVFRFFVT